MQKAVVCVDLNANGSCDSDEPASAATEAGGAFQISYAPADETAAGVSKAASLLAQINTDSVDSAKPNETAARKKFTLSAPAEKITQINPLTTLVQRHMRSSGANLADAEAAVALQLGIPVEQIYDYQSLPASSSAVLPDNARTAAQVTSYAIEMGADLRTFARTDAAEALQLLTRLEYRDPTNYFFALGQTDGAENSSGLISQTDIREGKSAGNPIPAAALYSPPAQIPNSLFITEQGWLRCDGQTARLVPRGTPNRSNSCNGTFYAFQFSSRDVSGLSMADVVSKLPDGSDALNQEGIKWMQNIWLNPAQLGTATFPSKSSLKTMVNIQTQMPRFIRDAATDTIGNFPSLNALIAARPASAVDLATASGTIGGLGAFDQTHSVRGAFVDASTIALYRCEADQPNYDNPRNCAALATSPITVRTIGGSKVLSLESFPQTTSPTLRGYAEYNGRVYTYHQSRPHQSEDDALSYVQLFDGNAWAGMKSALGL